MARFYYRKGDDPGSVGVRTWVDKWYGESSDLRIDEISIPVKPFISSQPVSKSEEFLAAAHKKQSSLHAFLKLVAHNWLANTCEQLPVYEQEMYFVDKEAVQNVFFKGLDLDPKVSQLLPKGYKLFDATFGITIVADVYCSRRTVEVGSTQPFNLCMPLLESLAEKSIWVPFPRGIQKAAFDPDEVYLSEIVAYEFSLALYQ